LLTLSYCGFFFLRRAGATGPTTTPKELAKHCPARCPGPGRRTGRQPRFLSDDLQQSTHSLDRAAGNAGGMP